MDKLGVRISHDQDWAELWNDDGRCFGLVHDRDEAEEVVEVFNRARALEVEVVSLNSTIKDLETDALANAIELKELREKEKELKQLKEDIRKALPGNLQ